MLEACSAPLSVWEIMHLVSDIGCGIKYLHEKGLMHRDLHAHNVLLDENFHAKISDFGQSCQLPVDGESLTYHPGYMSIMAPETFTQSYNCSSDLWSCGILISQIILRKIPDLIDDSTLDELVGKLLSQDKQQVEKLRLRPNLETVLNHSLQK